MYSSQSHQRFVKPNEGEQYPSEYDLSSSQIYDPIQRTTQPVFVKQIDLSSAGTLLLQIPGRAFVPYFFVTGSAVQTRQTDGLVSVYPNTLTANPAVDPFQAKHNRGFNGSFSTLLLSWGAQANTSVSFVIHRSDKTPWMTDDIQAAAGGAASIFFIQTESIANSGVLAYPSGKHAVITYLNSTGGAVTADLGPGNADGDIWKIIGTDATNTVQFDNDANQVMNGNYVVSLASVIEYGWVASLGQWVEGYRNGL